MIASVYGDHDHRLDRSLLRFGGKRCQWGRRKQAQPRGRKNAEILSASRSRRDDSLDAVVEREAEEEEQEQEEENKKMILDQWRDTGW